MIGLSAYAGQFKRLNFFPCDINGDGITDILSTEIIFDEFPNKYHYTELKFTQFVSKLSTKRDSTGFK